VSSLEPHRKMAKILMVHASKDGQTTKIVEHMARVAEEAGHEVRLAIPTAAPEELDGIRPDAVLIGASVRVGSHAPEVRDFITSRLSLLKSVPSALVSVSLAARDPESTDAQGYVDQLLKDTGWKPTITARVAGAITYSRYGFFRKLLMKRICRREGMPTDTSRDYELTDWDAVRETALALVERLPEAARSAR
jgi:menaquinone-dependent protoporphyrinogen oxidase